MGQNKKHKGAGMGDASKRTLDVSKDGAADDGCHPYPGPGQYDVINQRDSYTKTLSTGQFECSFGAGREAWAKVTVPGIGEKVFLGRNSVGPGPFRPMDFSGGTVKFSDASHITIGRGRDCEVLGRVAHHYRVQRFSFLYNTKCKYTQHHIEYKHTA